MAIEFDKGPPAAMASLFSQHPDYAPNKDLFWYNWGPIFYRGRLDKSARILCVASDPGPTERIGGRALIGNAGQRVQGFLAKTGITKSYVCLNGFVYSLHPAHLSGGIKLLKDPKHVSWRNKVFSRATGPKLQAIVAFGEVAQQAVELWTGKGATPVFNTFHPSYRGEESKLTADWNRVIHALKPLLSKDPDSNPNPAMYATEFREDDYAAIPRRDLPFGAPEFLGDDAWWRRQGSNNANTVKRPSGDDFSIIWKAPQI